MEREIVRELEQQGQTVLSVSSHQDNGMALLEGLTEQHLDALRVYGLWC